MLAAIIFLGLPYTSLTDGHVSVDFLTGRLGQRAQAVIIAVNALICAGLFGVITLQMAALAAEFLATQRTTITMRIPIALSSSSSPARQACPPWPLSSRRSARHVAPGAIVSHRCQRLTGSPVDETNC